jgi:hypothetical protein
MESPKFLISLPSTKQLSVPIIVVLYVIWTLERRYPEKCEKLEYCGIGRVSTGHRRARNMPSSGTFLSRRMAVRYGKSLKLSSNLWDWKWSRGSFRVPGIDLMISTCGQESSWIALLLARIFQKFVSVRLRKCGTKFSNPDHTDDQDEYKKLITDDSSDANISRCANLWDYSR